MRGALCETQTSLYIKSKLAYKQLSQVTNHRLLSVLVILCHVVVSQKKLKYDKQCNGDLHAEEKVRH